MFEGLLERILVDYFGVWLDGIDREQVHVAIFKGNTEFKNLRIRKEALDALQLPISVSHGSVGSFKIHFPWKKLTSSSVKIILSDIDLVISTNEDDSDNFCSQKWLERQRWSKKQTLHMWNLVRQSNDDGDGSGDNNATESLKTRLLKQIVDNLQIQLLNVHVRYEDRNRSGAVLGLRVNSISYCTTNANGHTSFVDRSKLSTPFLHKRVELERFEVYYNRIENTTRDFRILEPVTASIKVAINCSVEYSKLLPKYQVNLVLDAIKVQLSPMQVRDLLGMIDFLLTYELVLQQSQHWQQYRPTVSVSGNAKTWWKYATHAALLKTGKLKKEDKVYRRWFDVMDLIRYRNEYVCLYKTHVLPNSSYNFMTEQSEKNLDSLEDILQVEAIDFFRMLAIEEDKLERQRAKSLRKHGRRSLEGSSTATIPTSKPRWWSFSDSGADTLKTSTRTETTLPLHLMKLSQLEKQVLYENMGDRRANDAISRRNSAEFKDIDTTVLWSSSLALKELNFSILDTASCTKNLIDVKVAEIHVAVSTTAKSSWTVTGTVGTLQVQDTSEDALTVPFNYLVYSNPEFGELLKLSVIQRRSIVEGANAECQVDIKLAPLNFIYEPKVCLTIQSLFEEVHLADYAIMQMISDVRENEAVPYQIESQTVFSLTLNMAETTFSFIGSRSSTANEFLLCTIDKLYVTSDNSVKQDDELELNDRFIVQLSSVQVWLSDYSRGMIQSKGLCASNQLESSLILEPVDVNIIAHLPKSAGDGHAIRLESRVAYLDVSISDVQLKSILRLLETPHSPSNSDESCSDSSNCGVIVDLALTRCVVNLYTGCSKESLACYRTKYAQSKISFLPTAVEVHYTCQHAEVDTANADTSCFSSPFLLIEKEENEFAIEALVIAPYVISSTSAVKLSTSISCCNILQWKPSFVERFLVTFGLSEDYNEAASEVQPCVNREIDFQVASFRMGFPLPDNSKATFLCSHLRTSAVSTKDITTVELNLNDFNMVYSNASEVVSLMKFQSLKDAKSILISYQNGLDGFLNVTIGNPFEVLYLHEVWGDVIKFLDMHIYRLISSWITESTRPLTLDETNTVPFVKLKAITSTFRVRVPRSIMHLEGFVDLNVDSILVESALEKSSCVQYNILTTSLILSDMLGSQMALTNSVSCCLYFLPMAHYVLKTSNDSILRDYHADIIPAGMHINGTVARIEAFLTESQYHMLLCTYEENICATRTPNMEDFLKGDALKVLDFSIVGISLCLQDSQANAWCELKLENVQFINQDIFLLNATTSLCANSVKCWNLLLNSGRKNPQMLSNDKVCFQNSQAHLGPRALDLDFEGCMEAVWSSELYDSALSFLRSVPSMPDYQKPVAVADTIISIRFPTIRFTVLEKVTDVSDLVITQGSVSITLEDNASQTLQLSRIKGKGIVLSLCGNDSERKVVQKPFDISFESNTAKKGDVGTQKSVVQISDLQFQVSIFDLERVNDRWHRHLSPATNVSSTNRQQIDVLDEVSSTLDLRDCEAIIFRPSKTAQMPFLKLKCHKLFAKSIFIKEQGRNTHIVFDKERKIGQPSEVLRHSGISFWYFNTSVLSWEPLLEPWRFKLSLITESPTNGIDFDLVGDKDSKMNFNIPASFAEELADFALLQETQSHSASQNAKLITGTQIEVSIQNICGISITCWYSSNPSQKIEIETGNVVTTFVDSKNNAISDIVANFDFIGCGSLNDVPLNENCCFVARLEGPNGFEILFNISAIAGRRTFTISSLYVLENTTDIELEWSVQNAENNLSRRCSQQESGVSSIPLDFLNPTKIRVRPVNNFSKCSWEWSDIYDFEQSESLSVESKVFLNNNNGDSRRLKSVALRLRKEAVLIGTEDDNQRYTKILCEIMCFIKNELPETIECKIVRTGTTTEICEEVPIKSGAIVSSWQISTLKEYSVTFRLARRNAKWSSFYSVGHLDTLVQDATVCIYDGTQVASIKIGIEELESGSRLLYIYADACIENITKTTLQYEASELPSRATSFSESSWWTSTGECHTTSELEQWCVELESKALKDSSTSSDGYYYYYSESNELRLRFCKSVWSSKISLSSIGITAASTNIRIFSDSERRWYDFSLIRKPIAALSDLASSMVVVKPQYTFVNNSPWDISVVSADSVKRGDKLEEEWLTDGFSNLTEIKSKDMASIHWHHTKIVGEKRGLRLTFTDQLHWRWSGYFPLYEASDFVLLVSSKKTGAVRILRVNVSLNRKDASAIVKVSQESEEDPMYRVVNHSRMLIHLSQNIEGDKVTTLRVFPSESLVFGWEKPFSSTGHRLLSLYNLVKDKAVQVSFDEMNPLFDKHREGEAAATAEISIPASKSHDEFQLYVYCYIDGITKTCLICDNLFTYAELYQKMNQYGERILLKQELKWKARVTLPEITASLLDKQNTELLFLWLNQFSIKRTLTDDETIELKLESVQVDNQLETAYFPVAISPVAKNQTFLHILVVRAKYSSQLLLYKYVSVLLCELVVNLEEDILMRVLHFARTWKTVVETLVKNSTNDDASVVVVSQVYMQLLEIHPVMFQLSFQHSSEQNIARHHHRAQVYYDMPWIFGLLQTHFANVDAARICFNALHVYHSFTDGNLFLLSVLGHFKDQFARQIYSVLGAAEVFGNPLGLVSNLGTGVVDFFYEPAKGLVHSPAAFAGGISRGTASLVRNSVLGTFNTASKLTGSLGTGLATLSLDQSYLSGRYESSRAERPTDVGEGIFYGTKNLGKGIVSGITGIVSSPALGAYNHGISGFVGGVGRGIVGAAVKPAVGIIDFASNTTAGITATAAGFSQDKASRRSDHQIRKRKPRLPSMELTIYSCEEESSNGED